MSHLAGVVILKRMYPTVYWCFAHNGSIVVFSSVTNVSGAFAIHCVWMAASQTHKLIDISFYWKQCVDIWNHFILDNGSNVLMCNNSFLVKKNNQTINSVVHLRSEERFSIFQLFVLVLLTAYIKILSFRPATVNCSSADNLITCTKVTSQQCGSFH